MWRGGISAGRASLQGANLRHADLRHANLRGAALEGAQLSGSQADQATIWLKGFDPGQRDQRGRAYESSTKPSAAEAASSPGKTYVTTPCSVKH